MKTTKEIIKIEEEVEPLKNCTLTPVGLEIRKDLPFEKWAAIGKSLKKLNGALQWWWGDWMVYGDITYGEMSSQELEACPYDESRLRILKSICSNVKLLTRVNNLSFAHHRLVAPLKEKEQSKWLRMAEENNWTIWELKQAIKESKQKEIPLPKGKYQIIYADPPWEYDRTIGQGVACEQYPLLNLEEICNLPTGDLAAEDSVLFLWATFPKLKEALTVIEAWGFKYRTLGFSWIKLNPKNKQPFFGIGSYAKSNCEVCLLATKGDPHKLVKDNSISSVVITEREAHSKKPKEVRDRIEKLFGNVSRIELFAREKAKGWKSWGDQV